MEGAQAYCQAIALKRGADAYDAMEYHLMVIRSRLMEDW